MSAVPEKVESDDFDYGDESDGELADDVSDVTKEEYSEKIADLVSSFDSSMSKEDLTSHIKGQVDSMMPMLSMFGVDLGSLSTIAERVGPMLGKLSIATAMGKDEHMTEADEYNLNISELKLEIKTTLAQPDSDRKDRKLIVLRANLKNWQDLLTEISTIDVPSIMPEMVKKAVPIRTEEDFLEKQILASKAKIFELSSSPDTEEKAAKLVDIREKLVIAEEKLGELRFSSLD